MPKRKISKADRLEMLAREYIHLIQLSEDKDFAEISSARLKELTFAVSVMGLDGEFYNALFAVTNKGPFSEKSYRGKEQLETVRKILKPYSDFDVRFVDRWLEDVKLGFTSLSEEATKCAIACLTYIKEFCSLKYIKQIG